MSDLRDKIVDHLQGYSGFDAADQRREYALQIADAILALIRENVPPLVWHVSDTGDLIADAASGRYQVQFGGSLWCCMYAMGNRFVKPTKPTYHRSEEAAKAAANEHHVNAVLKAAGLSHE